MNGFADPYSPSLRANPELDRWLRFNDDQTVTIFIGKVELGQGIKTAVALIAAEELDVELSCIRVTGADTLTSPDEQYTASSQSVEDCGSAVRLACAEAKQAMLRQAAAELRASVANLRVVNGRVTADAAAEHGVTFWQLMAGKRFQQRISPETHTKDARDYRLVGRSATRIDLPDKIFGRPCFVHDMQMPDMLHARVIRPPAPGARLVEVDLSAAKAAFTDVEFVLDGSFLASAAADEFRAVSAAAWLSARCTWADPSPLQDTGDLKRYLREHVSHSLPVVNGVTQTGTVQARRVPQAARSLRRCYSRPFILHGALGPSAAVASHQNGRLTVWTHNQGVTQLALALADVLRLDRESVRVIHVEGAGSYGHNAAEDVAFDASVLALRFAPSPVLVVWSREDEHKWEPFGSPMVVEVEAAVDEQGDVIAWNHEVWTTSHLNRALPSDEFSGFLSSWYLASPRRPPPQLPRTGIPHFGGARNADPIYQFPARVVKHFISESPFRTSTLRSLGAYANILAIESFLDELAEVLETDALAYRERHLNDPRALEVLDLLGRSCGWAERSRFPRGGGRGLGLAFARYKNNKTYAGVAVQLVIQEGSFAPKLERGWIVADAGQVIDPSNLIQQLEGGFLQSASWTLKETVSYDSGRVTSVDWDAYPILRCSESPQIETKLVERTGLTPLGAGEATQGPTAAAIANALAHALGVRLYDVPFTPAKVRAALFS